MEVAEKSVMCEKSTKPIENTAFFTSHIFQAKVRELNKPCHVPGHNKDISEGEISMLSEFKTCAERQYYSEYFQRLLRAIDSRDKMNRTVRSLHSENKLAFDHREAAIEAARKDLELVRLGMDAPQDSAAYKMAQALIEDAKQSS